MKSIADMTPITQQELLDNFDAILDRVEAGECFVIDKDEENAVVLIPYDDDTSALIKLLDYKRTLR